VVAVVSPGVLEYLQLERALLSHRVARWLAGLPDEEDAREAALLDGMDTLWREMTPGLRAELERIREASATAWSWPGAGGGSRPPRDVAAHDALGLPPRRRAGAA
jgi:hypothetical protein